MNIKKYIFCTLALTIFAANTTILSMENKKIVKKEKKEKPKNFQEIIKFLENRDGKREDIDSDIEKKEEAKIELVEKTGYEELIDYVKGKINEKIEGMKGAQDKYDFACETNYTKEKFITEKLEPYMDAEQIKTNFTDLTIKEENPELDQIADEFVNREIPHSNLLINEVKENAGGIEGGMDLKFFTDKGYTPDQVYRACHVLKKKGEDIPHETLLIDLVEKQEERIKGMLKPENDEWNERVNKAGDKVISILASGNDNVIQKAAELKAARDGQEDNNNNGSWNTFFKRTLFVTALCVTSYVIYRYLKPSRIRGNYPCTTFADDL